MRFRRYVELADEMFTDITRDLEVKSGLIYRLVQQVAALELSMSNRLVVETHIVTHLREGHGQSDYIRYPDCMICVRPEGDI